MDVALAATVVGAALVVVACFLLWGPLALLASGVVLVALGLFVID